MYHKIKHKVKINLHKAGWCKLNIPGVIRVLGNGKSYRIEYKDGFQTRVSSSIELINMAFNRYSDKIQDDIDIYIYTDDRADEADKLRKELGINYIFAYSTMKSTPNVIPICDFIYHSWSECGMNSWEETIEKCLEAGDKPYEDEHLFWIGNLQTNTLRQKLFELGKRNPSLLKIEGMQWMDFKIGEKQTASKFVSLYDHAKYKYLIDVEGRGYSGRLKVLLALQRPVFIVQREHEEFWFKHLIDMHNCVIIKPDLSDLVDKINLLNNNEEKYRSLVHNQNILFKNYVEKDIALDNMIQSFIRYGIK